MTWKTPAVLSLLLLAAAAAAPPDCQPNAASGRAAPIPLDLAGRPNFQTGFAADGLGSNGCRSPAESNAESSTLRDNTSDVLHGLPIPDSLRPIDQPNRAPEFR